MTLGALEPKFCAAWCRGVGREDLVEQPVRAARLAPRTPRSRRSSLQRTRDEWAAFAAEHDCCLEPVLELEEALDSELVRAREMVVEFEQPGAGPVRGLGHAGQALAHAGRACAAAARRSASTPSEVLRRGRLRRRRDRRAAWSRGAVAGAGDGRRRGRRFLAA